MWEINNGSIPITGVKPYIEVESKCSETRHMLNVIKTGERVKEKSEGVTIEFELDNTREAEFSIDLTASVDKYADKSNCIIIK